MTLEKSKLNGVLHRRKSAGVV